MKKIFERVADFLEENGNAEKEYRDVYLFAMQTVVVYTFNIGSGLVIGACMGETIYCIFFLAAFILLRQEAGGYHTQGWKSCYFLSCGILVLTLLWIKEDLIYQTYFTVSFAVAAAAGILFFAPLEDKNKPLEKQEKTVVRRRAQITAVSEILAGMILLFCDKKAAYVVFYAVIWCGVGYLAWALKRYSEKKENNRKNSC